MSRVLIGVTTCHARQFVPRAQSQRDTWVLDATGLADVLFFSGDRHIAKEGYHRFSQPDGWRNGDEVFLDCGDGYLERPGKIKAMCQWALAQGYDRVFKTDDDVYIDVPGLLEAEYHGAEYIGRPVESKQSSRHMFASGFGYWLGQWAMRVIAEDPAPDGLEDQWVGKTLADAGITLLGDRTRYVACYPGIEPRFTWRLPATRNGVVFCEYKMPAKMLEMHAARNAARG